MNDEPVEEITKEMPDFWSAMAGDIDPEELKKIESTWR
jgi:hypothetical protein